METTLARWGNSLGLRIPKASAASAGFKEGDLVVIESADGGIFIRKARVKPAYDLAGLLSRVTPENRHSETDWGVPQGREIW